MNVILSGTCSPADMSKNRVLCEESTKFGTVIVLDEVKQTRYGGNSKNLNYGCLGPIFHENEAENWKWCIFHYFFHLNWLK